ncbi:root UVB sensitive protein [Chloropicon primus]|uniref:Root UVB sensitive protein n=1 Tax=Chloropicon primus TaxID=1764295 RepID=A0A5B8ML38_9CHLO|nr:root UVB sensitive protein [Chloropicon primus]UPQ99624.1 root UVB sensitive protein [Chloropicon primus]|eukprot:QDZ20415.1 root UVB sensitive protein [Chloropicon primus]
MKGKVLSSQALLVAVSRSSVTASTIVDGLGYSASLAAATQWVLKDAPGSVATLAVGSRGGQAFDEDPKRWWVLSSALEDMARLLEILLPLHPGWFLPGAALANCVRSGALVGRQSLVNGTILRHFALRENLGDIRAKLEAQGRILAIAALPIGISLFRWTEGLTTVVDNQGGEAISPAGLLAAGAVYGSIFLSHNWFCFKAAQALKFTNLNAFRLTVLARHFVAQNKVLGVGDVAALEGVYSSRQEQTGQIRVGINFKSFSDESDLDLNEVLEIHNREGYLLTLAGKTVLVCIKTEAEDSDVIQAVLQAQLLLSKSKSNAMTDPSPNKEELMRESLEEATSALESFLERLRQSGWSTQVVRGAWNTIHCKI